MSADHLQDPQCKRASRSMHSQVSVFMVFSVWFSICFSVSFFVALEHVQDVFGPQHGRHLGGQDGSKFAPKWSWRRLTCPKWMSSNSLCFTILLALGGIPRRVKIVFKAVFVHFAMYVDFRIVFEYLLELPKSNLVGNMSPPRGPRRSLRSGQNEVKNWWKIMLVNNVNLQNPSVFTGVCGLPLLG